VPPGLAAIGHALGFNPPGSRAIVAPAAEAGVAEGLDGNDRRTGELDGGEQLGEVERLAEAEAIAGIAGLPL